MTITKFGLWTALWISIILSFSHWAKADVVLSMEYRGAYMAWVKPITHEECLEAIKELKKTTHPSVVLKCEPVAE